MLFLLSIVAYPTPYITAQDRSNRCLALFSHFNSTGTANLSFIGQNTYHNPCKIECALCVEDELPEEKEEANVLRSYPPHISLKESIVHCPDDVEIYEQYMQDGVRCGPYHVSFWIQRLFDSNSKIKFCSFEIRFVRASVVWQSRTSFHIPNVSDSVYSRRPP